MLISTAVCTVLPILIWIGTLNLGWSRLIVIGTAITFVMGYLLGPITKESVKIKVQDTN